MLYGLFSLEESEDSPHKFEIQENGGMFRLFLIDQKGKKHLCFCSGSQMIIFGAKILAEKIAYTDFGLINDLNVEWDCLFEIEQERIIEKENKKNSNNRSRKRQAKNLKQDFFEETDRNLSEIPGFVFKIPDAPPMSKTKTEQPKLHFGDSPSEKPKFRFNFLNSPKTHQKNLPKKHKKVKFSFGAAPNNLKHQSNHPKKPTTFKRNYSIPMPMPMPMPIGWNRHHRYVSHPENKSVFSTESPMNPENRNIFVTESPMNPSGSVFGAPKNPSRSVFGSPKNPSGSVFADYFSDEEFTSE